MAYTTLAEIQAEFKAHSGFTSTTTVKDTDVTQFITESDALINSYVGMRYVTPVATGDGLNLLKMYSRGLVANRVKGILEVKQATNIDANQNVRSGLSTTNILKLLQDIKDGETALAGATLLESGAGFYSSNYENAVCHEFHKDCKEW